MFIDLLAGEGGHGGIEALGAVAGKPIGFSVLGLVRERLMEWVLEALAIAFVAIASVWFVIAQAYGILNGVREAREARRKKKELRLSTVRFSRQ